MDTTGALTSAQRQDLSASLSQRYGIELFELEGMGGELDWNFRAIDTSSSNWFVRLTPTPTDLAVVEWQDRVLRQLEQKPLSVDVPRLLPQRGGARHSIVTLDGEEFVLRVTSWMPGRTASKVGRTSRPFRRQIGALAAEIVGSLCPLNASAPTQHAHHWTVVSAGDSIRATMSAASGNERELLQKALSWFDGVADRIPDLPLSVVHQDLHDFNMLTEEGDRGGARICAVVDFNDAVYTARIAELAVASTYATLRQRDPVSAFTDVVEGYLAQRNLEDVELDVLYPLGVARLAVNASTWLQRSTGPNKKYAKSRMAATWPALEALLRVTPEDAATEFHALAQRETPWEEPVRGRRTVDTNGR